MTLCQLAGDGSATQGYIGRIVTATTDHAAPLDSEPPASFGAPDLALEQCAVARCAEIVSAKWTLLVVRDLVHGPRSYSELEASLVGISPRTLCDRLKLLAAEGLITRTRIKGLPPRTVYELTERGFALAPIIETMRTVGEELLTSPPDAAAAAAIDADGCCS